MQKRVKLFRAMMATISCLTFSVVDVNAANPPMSCPFATMDFNREEAHKVLVKELLKSGMMYKNKVKAILQGMPEYEQRVTELESRFKMFGKSSLEPKFYSAYSSHFLQEDMKEGLNTLLYAENDDYVKKLSETYGDKIRLKILGKYVKCSDNIYAHLLKLVNDMDKRQKVEYSDKCGQEYRDRISSLYDVLCAGTLYRDVQEKALSNGCGGDEFKELFLKVAGNELCAKFSPSDLEVLFGLLSDDDINLSVVMPLLALQTGNASRAVFNHFTTIAINFMRFM